MRSNAQVKLLLLFAVAIAAQKICGVRYLTELILLVPLFITEPDALGFKNFKRGALFCLPLLPIVFLFQPDKQWLNQFLGQLGVATGEEIFFRGFLMLKFSNPIVSAAFALTHVAVSPTLLAAATFLPSLFFGYLYKKTGSIIAPMAWHFSANLVFFTIQKQLQDKAVHTPVLDWLKLSPF